MFFLKSLPSTDMIRSFLDQHSGVSADNIQDALILMRRASVLVREIEQYFAKHGLSQLRYLILIVIAREPKRDSLRIHEIIDRVDVSKPVMTRTLAAMQKDGLITLSDDPEDGRGKIVTPTQTAADMLTNLLPGYFEILNAHMKEAKHDDQA